MPQSAPGFAPSLPARPDREAEFLKALGRRDANTCLQLLQHLVHRQGVGALDSLRRRSRALESEQRSWIWLDLLLAAEPIAAAALQSPQENAFSDPNPGGDAVASPGSAPPELAAGAVAVGPASTMDGAVAAGSAADDRLAGDLGSLVADGSIAAMASAAASGLSDQGSELLTSAEPLASQPELQKLVARPDLDMLAVAAVDAAFEALAAEFPGQARSVVAEPGHLVEPAQLESAEVGVGPVEASASAEGEGMPSESLDPTQQRRQSSPFDPIDQLDQGQTPGLAEHSLAQLPAAHSDPFGNPGPELQPQRIFSFVIPRPLDQSPVGSESGAKASTVSDLPRDGQALGAAPQGDTAQGEQVAGFWGRAEGRMAGLGDRLRSRFSLTRVKALVRDCVEEAVTSLQGPNSGVGSQPQLSQEPAEAATTLAGTAASGTTPAAPRGADAPAASWSLAQPDDYEALVGEAAAPLSPHQAPVAAFGPRFADDAWSPNPTAAEPQARLSTTQQLRQRLLGRRQGETRPAPAPQALSALRAWLAADDDLPRAS